MAYNFKPILESVKNFILRRKIIEKPLYITKSPDIHTLKELGKFMSRKKALENIELKKKLLQAESKLEEKGKEKERILEEQELMESIRKQKEHMQKLEKERAIPLKFMGLKENPTLFTKSEIPICRVQGMYMKETKEGYLLFYPWLEGKKSKIGEEPTKILKEPVTNFKKLFRKEIGIVSQMRGGKIDSNYEIDEEGKLIYIPQKELDVEKQYKILHLSDIEAKEYETHIEQLKNLIRENYGKIKDMKKREVEFEVQISENEVLMDSTIKERDLYASQYGLLVKKQEGMYQQMLSAVSEIGDVKTRAILSERLAKSMESALETYRGKFEEAVSKEISDIEREKLMELQKDSMSNIERMIDKAKELVPKQKEVVIKKEKAEEEYG